MGRPVGRTSTEWWNIPTGKRNIGRDLTHTGLYVIESDPRFIHTCHFISSSGHFIYFHIRWDFILCFTHRTIVSATDPGWLILRSAPPAATLQNEPPYGTEECQRLQSLCRWKTLLSSSQLTKRRRSLTIHYITRTPLCTSRERDTGSWKGWIGDHSVEFLVDSGSSVTAISDVLYGNLLQAGAPVGATSDYSADVTQREWDRH